MARLEALPVEVIVMVFKNLKDWSTVINLAATSPTLNNIFNQHLSAIMYAVLPRSIICIEDAQTLVDMQKRKKIGGRLIPVSEDDSSRDGIIKKAQAMFQNQKVASKVCDYFDKLQIRPAQRQQMPSGTVPLTPAEDKRLFGMKENERARFFHAFYRFWILVLSYPPSKEPTLEATDLRELVRINTVASWVMFNKRKLVKTRWVRDALHDWNETFELLSDEIDEKHSRIEEARTGPDDGPRSRDGAPVELLSILDRWQDEFNSAVPEFV